MPGAPLGRRTDRGEYANQRASRAVAGVVAAPRLSPMSQPAGTSGPLRILLASPRGFCAGVERAIDVVELALRKHGAPVYVRHQIVHNTHVVRELEAKGAVFVEDEREIPEGAIMVLSAHGTPPQVRERAAERDLHVIDATCPLVTKVHLEALDYHRRGHQLVLVGHAGHQEVVGTMGHAPMELVERPEDVDVLDLDPQRPVAYLSQTTLSVDEAGTVVDRLLERRPDARGPKGDDICYATQNRQDATKQLAGRADLVLVVGSANSSNSNRMVEVALEHGARDARLIDSAADIDPSWLEGVDVVGLTSGASVPDELVGQVVDHLAALPRGATVDRLDVVDEGVTFALPKELRDLDRAERAEVADPDAAERAAAEAVASRPTVEG